MNLYQEYKNKKQDYSKFLNENLDEIITAAIEDLKTNLPTAKKLIIVGYTPSWNDGETCHHTSYSFYQNFAEAAEISEFDEDVLKFIGVPLELQEQYEEDEDEFSCEIYDWIVENTKFDIPMELQQVAIGITSDIEDLVEKYWDTDFILLIDLEAEKVSIQHIDYECGY